MSNNPQNNPPKFDTEALLKDILEVLRKHNLPIQSAELNISMFDADFDEKIPHLQTYKAGHFHRPMLIDAVPMLLHAQRRIPFEQIVTWFEENIVPSVQAESEALKQAFPDYAFSFSTSRPTGGIIPHHASYLIKTEFRLNEEQHEDYVVLEFCIAVNQKEMNSYPTMSAFVGWLVDEESGDDWGLDVVYSRYPWNDPVAEHHLVNFRKSLPEFHRQFRQAIEKRIQEDSGQMKD